MMISRALLCIFTLLLTTLPAHAEQKEMWWSYIAQYDKLPGTTLVNLALRKQAPNANFPYVVIAGVDYEIKRADRLPDSKELDRLQALDEQAVNVITSITPAIWAGTFTNDGQRLQYVYVKNSNGLEAALKKFYATQCAGCKPYIHIKEDRNWDAYSNFLYPNSAVQTANKEELAKLKAADAASGDTACTSRTAVEDLIERIRTHTKWDIDHNMVWGYFFVASAQNPLSMLGANLKNDGYRIVDDMGRPDKGEPYWLHVEKIETHTVDSLDKRDHELCDLASKFPDSKYDGMDVGPVGGNK